MKKTGILNKQLNEVIGSLGHMDSIVVSDAALPIPDEKQRVDLAFEPGALGQIQVLRGLLKEIIVEKVIMAYESEQVSPKMYSDIISLLNENEITDIEYVPHVEFKRLSEASKAIVRTGEFTPYSNVLLICGCPY